MSAPATTSLPIAILAPALSKSLSRMPAFSPAPFSTATSAPIPTMRLTVSGVAATRGSPGSASAGIAIFMAGTAARLGKENEHKDENDDDRDHDPFGEGEKILVGSLMLFV